MRRSFHLRIAFYLALLPACDGSHPDHGADAPAAATRDDDAGPSSAPADASAASTRGMGNEAGTDTEHDAAMPRADAGATTRDAGASTSCAATSCPTEHDCDDSSGSAVCVARPSCKTVKCTAGSTCQLVAVQCIRAPCPAQPQCVPTASGVCNLLCVQGKRCVVTSSGPSCVANEDAGTAEAGVACGQQTCAAGEKCCSQTCGICGPAHGVCPAIACAPQP